MHTPSSSEIPFCAGFRRSLARTIADLQAKYEGLVVKARPPSPKKPCIDYCDEELDSEEEEELRLRQIYKKRKFTYSLFNAESVRTLAPDKNHPIPGW